MAKGKGKGRGKGKGDRRQSWTKREKPQPAPANTKVNETKRHAGQCVYFSRRNGFGFIKPTQDGLVPDDKLMVVWDEIQSGDSWPFLYKGLDVEFKVTKTMTNDGTGCWLKAVNVSLPGNKKVNLQHAAENEKEYVHSKTTRFSGVVKWYSSARGNGIVTLDDGFAGVEGVPKNLRVVRNEINAGGEGPFLVPDLKVEFGIQKNKSGFYTCYNLSQPGGKIVKRTDVEERKVAGGGPYNGVVNFYNWRSGYGYIKPDNLGKLPGNVKTAVDKSLKDAKERSPRRNSKTDAPQALIWFRRQDITSGNGANKDDKVNFKTYVDNRGAGACDVKIA